MKRFLSLILICILVFSIGGCTTIDRITPTNEFYYDKIDTGIKYAENIDKEVINDFGQESISVNKIEITDELKELLTKNVLELIKRRPCIYPTTRSFRRF